jgi:hypothetical protein
VLTTILLGSGVSFLFYCSVGNAYLASYCPPILYLGLLAFILNPTNVLFKVRRRREGWCLYGRRSSCACAEG